MAASAVASGLAITIGVPFVALHELIVKRQNKNMKRHLPQLKKKVNFDCERPAEEIARRTPPPLPLTAAEEKALEAALTIPLPLPPIKSTLRRSPSPPPAYEEFDEKKVARIDRVPVVRFAQMA